MPITGSRDDDYTPLGLAVREGHIDIVQALLDAGADIRRVIGLMKGTPVHEASFFGRADIVRLLTEDRTRAGAPAFEVDAQGPYNGLTALHDAVWHGHLDSAKALVEAGALLDLRTHAGLTPRELAVEYGYDKLVQFLEEAEQQEEATPRERAVVASEKI
ncbi:ankyrin repeat domain-containing protein [Pararhizobium sp. PWRC1-1]|uniref:ankyrin repeat domain-containing protein n=1 Tax=Pararhizobium sp. PWRC1-1 TaxID=2804566 RepID=UPI003CFB7AE9